MKNTPLYLLLPLLLTACASFKPYSYDTKSKTTAFKLSDLQAQSQVTEQTLQSPLNNVCHLKTTRKSPKTLWLTNSTYHGSGALIENRFLITAAHNVFDYPANKLTSLKVTCGEPNIDTAKTTVILNRNLIEANVHVPRYESRFFRNTKKYEFDYAFIDLGKDVYQQSSFQLAAANASDTSTPVFIGGYPGGNLSKNGNILHAGTSTTTTVDQNLMSYNILTVTGNSGGPIWIDTDNTHKIIAVHVKNSAGRIVNDTLLSDWDAWRETR